ncbi:MAG: RseA family anti-sigma factor [Casimicrobiaceae bacterium]|nr:RseA family anti-sigma factor [Casimicrobiaceae bacterium]MDW8312377.1 RseA family anti-sigma factor [Burkholderiales bacterium]
MKAASHFDAQQRADRLREDISRWMDGELREDERERMMEALLTEEGRAIWAELHLIGDCVRGLPPGRADAAARICAALAKEPPILVPAARRKRLARESARSLGWGQLGRGGRAWLAVASLAAVGLVVTVAWRGLGGTDASAPGVALLPAASVNVPPAASTNAHVLPPAQWNAFLRVHQESADATSVYAVRQYLRPAVNVASE